MEQKQIIRPRNYFYEILVILNELALVAVWWLILQSPLKAVWAGCLTYLVLAWTLRLLFQKHHRNGIYQQMALNNLGVCYFHMGENRKALEVFKKFAEQNSNYPNIDHTIEEVEKRIEQADIPDNP